MKKRATFKVSFDVPEGADVEQCREYILNAVQSWRGGLDPNDEMFDLNYESVRVTYERGSITRARQQVVIDEFMELGNAASTHFADDSFKEWPKGEELKCKALELFDKYPELHERMREIAKGFLWSLQRERPTSG